MNFRLPNPIGDKYLDNFDKTFPRVHYLGPLCKQFGKRGTDLPQTDNVENVTCKSCITKLEKENKIKRKGWV